MTTFTDKPLFNLKQLITTIGVTATLAGGIVRFEFKTDSINSKLNTLIVLMDTAKRENTIKFAQFEQKLVTQNSFYQDLKRDVEVLKAIMKPEDIEIKSHR